MIPQDILTGKPMKFDNHYLSTVTEGRDGWYDSQASLGEFSYIFII